MSQLQSLEIGRLRIWLQYIDSAYTLHQGIAVLTGYVYSLPIEDRREGIKQIDQLKIIFAHCMNCILTTQFPIDDFRAQDPDDWERNFGY